MNRHIPQFSLPSPKHLGRRLARLFSPHQGRGQAPETLIGQARAKPRNYNAPLSPSPSTGVPKEVTAAVIQLNSLLYKTTSPKKGFLKPRLDLKSLTMEQPVKGIPPWNPEQGAQGLESPVLLHHLGRSINAMATELDLFPNISGAARAEARVNDVGQKLGRELDIIQAILDELPKREDLKHLEMDFVALQKNAQSVIGTIRSGSGAEVAPAGAHTALA